MAMPAVKLASTKEMTRSEWLDWRRLGIGGSDAPVIAGFSKYKSSVQVYLEKTGELAIEEATSEAAYFGTKLEDFVAAEFMERSGKKVRRDNAIRQHPKHPFMIANLDRLIVGENAGLECKTASEYLKDDWDGEDIPTPYLLQVQHYIEVCGFDRMYIAVLIGGNKFSWKKIERDQELIDYLIKIESDFWKMVERRTPPAFDGSEASTDFLKTLYPAAMANSFVDLPSESKRLVEQFKTFAAEEKQAAKKKDEAANQLKALLANQEVGFIGSHKVVWKNIITNRFDTKSFEKDYPDLAKKYIKPNDSRRFEIREVK